MVSVVGGRFMLQSLHALRCEAHLLAPVSRLAFADLGRLAIVPQASGDHALALSTRYSAGT